jgi:signal transduction histidine kinase
MSQRPDSAYYYFNKTATESRDSLQIAQAYNRMALIQSREGDNYGGQEDLLTSLKYLHEGRDDDAYCLVSDYNGLGNTSLNLKNYDTAIAYFDRAFQLAGDGRSKTVALNNKARTYQEMSKYAQAAAIYDSILPQSRTDKKEFARVLTNLVTVRWLRDSDYRAAPDLLLALEMREAEKDDWGLNSSYAHLADYYRRSRPDSALYYARAMYAVASRLESPDDELEALEKLIALSPVGELKPYFARYRILKDSLETARNRSKSQFALIRYDAERTKTENLRLERENAERKTDAVRQQAISVGAILAMVILIVVGRSWYRKRKRFLEWEKERAIREDRLRTSQKMHDVVANGLYRVMMEIEHGEKLEREPMLDKIETLYLQSRDISYEQAGVSGGDIQTRLGQLISPFARTGTKVLIVGNDPAVWEGVGEQIKRTVEVVLQELMVNMDKHSGAQNVVIRFETEARGLRVQYTDDGIGLPADLRFGNGLANTETRISTIGGRIIFGQNAPRGTKIEIYLPNN